MNLETHVCVTLRKTRTICMVGADEGHNSFATAIISHAARADPTEAQDTHEVFSVALIVTHAGNMF